MTKKERLAVLGACALICLICIACGIQRHYSVAITDSWQRGYEVGLAVERPIPTIPEIQERIGAKPDGIWGAETNRLYDKALANQAASEHDYYYEEPNYVKED